MTTLRAGPAVGLAFCGVVLAAKTAGAQMALPAPRPPDGAALFKQQCATCHTINPSESIRQGPPLFRVIGRHAGKLDGFHYSPGLANADFVWDEARLDAWLTNPQAMIPGAFMMYRQTKPETRAAIIAYLKELK